MKLKRKERELLTTIISLLQKLLDSGTHSTSRRRQDPRQRRSRAEAVELKRKVLAARQRNVSVKQIAEELGVTPSYVYQLQR
jgi:hypothetical protein